MSIYTDGYTKLFRTMMKSSVWSGTPKYVKVLWVTLMALADQNGEVRSSVPGLMKEAELKRVECEKALAYFLGPDSDSQTKTSEGRRIIAIDGGWKLLNHAKYKMLMSKEDALARDAARKREERARGNKQDVKV